jgi:hypothetical protein
MHFPHRPLFVIPDGNLLLAFAVALAFTFAIALAS